MLAKIPTIRTTNLLKTNPKIEKKNTTKPCKERNHQSPNLRQILFLMISIMFVSLSVKVVCELEPKITVQVALEIVSCNFRERNVIINITIT